MLTVEQFERRQAQEAAKPSGMQAKQAKKVNRKENRAALKEQRLQAKAEKAFKKQEKAEKRAAIIAHGENPDDWVDEDDEYDYEERDWLDEEDEDAEIEIVTGESLFDDEILEDWPKLLEYMEAKFGFLIPHIDRVKDMEMLCTYLQIKINHCHRCLYSSKRFRSAEAVKAYMASKGNRRFNSDTFEAEFGKFYHPLAETRQGEQDRLVLAEHGTWGTSGEEGVTASGKKLVPRDLAWVTKQTPKPEESHPGVLAARAEAEERALAGYIMPGTFRKIIKSEMRKQDVHFQSKQYMQRGVKQNKNQVIPFECMLFGR